MMGKTILDLRKRPEERKAVPPIWLHKKEGPRMRVHLAGLGDVGRTTLTALALLGGASLNHWGFMI